MQIQSAVWSNAFFLVPLGLSLWHRLFFHAVLIALVIIFSTAFHLSGRRKFGVVDKVFAYALIGYNLYLCYLSGFRQPYFALALLFVIVGLYFLFKRKRDDYEWHASSAAITVFCILAYIL